MQTSDKALVSFSSYNSPHFLEHALETYERIDPGYPCDLLVLDNSNTDLKSLKILEKYSKKYRIETKPNYGRAQGGYQYAWENNKDYKYHFFLHDDSAFIRNNWLKVAVDRINDQSMEPDIITFADNPKEIQNLLVGKVGFQAYEWGNKHKYLRTKYNQIFNYMDPVADILNLKIPQHYQHINDDKVLYSKECLAAIGSVASIEDWKQKELTKDPIWLLIHQWFKQAGLHNNQPFAPADRYGENYSTFQTVSEFLNDIGSMLNRFRTHCVIGDGYCQEEEGWTTFRGNEYISHYGDHVVFKRLSLLLNQPEESIRSRFKDRTFLTICDNLIKNDSKKYMEKLNENKI